MTFIKNGFQTLNYFLQKKTLQDMAIYSIKELSDLTGVDSKNIHVYIKRGKLIKDQNSKIDSSIAINELFIKKYAKSDSKKIDFDNDERSEEKSKNQNDTSASSMMQVEYAIKKLNAQKLQRDILIKDEELKRKKGDVIDLESTLSIVSTYSEALKKEFSLQIQTHIQDICARHGIEPEKSGEYKLKVIEIINESSKKSITILRELKK